MRRFCKALVDMDTGEAILFPNEENIGIDIKILNSELQSHIGKCLRSKVMKLVAFFMYREVSVDVISFLREGVEK